MQHGELLRTDRVRIALKIGDGKWRDAHSWSDQEIHSFEDVDNGTPDALHFAPALKISNSRYLGPGPNPFQSCRLVELRTLFNVILVISIGFCHEDWGVVIHPG